MVYILANFEIQHKALKDAIKRDLPNIPKLKKNGFVTKWSPSFEIDIFQHYGTHEVLLKCLIRENVVVPVAANPLANGMPHLMVGGSIIADVEYRISHTHALFQQDNEIIFVSLDKAVRDSKFCNMVKPFEKVCDGHGAYLAIRGKQARDDKWDRIIETAEAYTTKKQ